MRTIPETVYFRTKSTLSPETLAQQILPAGWILTLLSSAKEQQAFYDTFEWHAFEKGVAVQKKERILFLIDINSGQKSASVSFQGNPLSFFSETLPDSLLQTKLCSLSNIRAFSRLCLLNTFTTSYRLLDQNSKTVAIIAVESIQLTGHERYQEEIHLLALTPFKGYEEDTTPIHQSLSALEAVHSVLNFRELFLLLMKCTKQRVQGYSAKFLTKLHPDATIHESALLLLEHTFSVMLLNKNGIKKNIDSEFLHDYRVALRRTRSIMKLLMGIFNERENQYFLNLFRTLGKRTNDLRDRDVYLLRKKSYCNSLPPNLQPSLIPFFDNIAESRKVFHRRLSRYLSSSDYQVSLNEWEGFLNQQTLPDVERTPQGSRSTKSVALETIKRAWKKLLRRGRQISRETTDTELHALRIDCKKLRYLLEFFASIFQPDAIIPVIRQLKELQENLGAFVDASVQLHFLHQQLELIHSDTLFAASMGGLMVTLFQKKEEARLKFNKTFTSFDHEETSQLFHDLLTGSSL
ncbi:MAG: CHAD domain-containing protein [Chlorobium sp.]